MTDPLGSDQPFVVFDRALIDERAWWVRQFAEIDVRTELRPDSAGPVSRQRWEQYTHQLPSSLVQAIDQLTGGSPLLTFATVLCGAAGCLARMHGKEFAVVGAPGWISSPVGGTDAVAIAVQVPADVSFRGLLVAQRELLLAVAERQRYPLRRLLADLGLSAAGGSPLFGVLIASPLVHRPAPDAGQDITITIDSSTAPVLRVEFLAERYAIATVQRFVSYVCQFLASALREPDRPIGEIALIDAAEERRLVATWLAPLALPRGRTSQLPAMTNLTRNQLLVWAGQRLHPQVPLYNMVTLTVVDGPVDVPAFAFAWRAVVAGTDALRTVVREQAGEPRAVVVDEFSQVVEHLDWGGEPSGVDRVDTWARARLVRPLDLTQCAFDCVVITLGPDRWAWYLCVHHLVTDGLSNLLLYRRTAELYQRASSGLPLAPPGWSSYARVVAADHCYRDTAACDQAEAYWAQLLRPLPEPLRWFGRSPRHRQTRTD